VARELRIVATLLVALVLSVACGNDDETPEAFPAACTLPSPEPGVDTSSVPEEFVLEGSEIRQVSDEKDLFVVALNVPVGVDEAFRAYRRQLSPPDYEIVSEDFEGFEAELFLRRAEDGKLMAVQIRRPNCSEASAVFVTVAKKVKG
jgi:hypothetical protein